MKKLNKDITALNHFSAGRVAVIGDIMLDAYLWGAVNRISPEAPVPVVDYLSLNIKLVFYILKHELYHIVQNIFHMYLFDIFAYNHQRYHFLNH